MVNHIKSTEVPEVCFNHHINNIIVQLHVWLIAFKTNQQSAFSDIHDGKEILLVCIWKW